MNNNLFPPTMKLLLERYSSGKEDTLGKLYMDGEFVCYTLEDQKRDVKVMGDTRIPEGTYEIKLRTVGTHHAKYSKKFPQFHAGMLHLQNVPNFQYILIHIGNTDKDTMGCILVGQAIGTPKGDKREILYSTMAYNKMYPPIAKALKRGEKVTIEIKTIG